MAKGKATATTEGVRWKHKTLVKSPCYYRVHNDRAQYGNDEEGWIDSRVFTNGESVSAAQAQGVLARLAAKE